MRDINRHEQKLENVLLYFDFLNQELPIILLKDGSLLVLFQLSGLDYEGLSEEQKEQFSHYARTAFEQLPDEGSGFMISNLLIRDTPRPLPLRKNPSAPPLIQFVQDKKQAFWDDQIAKSFGNRILCGLRYFHTRKKEPAWSLLIQENRLFRFYLDQIRQNVETLEQGYLALASGFARFGFRPLDREGSFAALYELINFAPPPAYRPDLSLNAQLAQSHYVFRPGEEYLLINGREYISLVGMKYPPPTSLAMYLRRFYELWVPVDSASVCRLRPKGASLQAAGFQHSYRAGFFDNGSQEPQACGRGEGFSQPD